MLPTNISKRCCNMRKSTTCSLDRASFFEFHPIASCVIALLFLFILASVSFCATWESVGPAGGDFLASITNPTDANQVTLLTGSPSPASVYRSMDGGASWSKIGEVPTSDELVDFSAFDFSNLFAIAGIGCYHSTDGGLNWSYAAFPSSEVQASRICVEPTDSNTVYAAAGGERGLTFFKSADAGLTWSMSEFFISGDFDFYGLCDMAISRSNPNIIYVGGYTVILIGPWNLDFDAFLLKSSDGGTSWTDVSSSFESLPWSLDSVVIDPTDSNRVYVVKEHEFYCGTVNGSDISWVIYSTDFDWVSAIVIDPTDASRIYVGDRDGVHVSTDYGQSWNMYSDNSFGGASVQHIEVAPACPSTIYACTHLAFFKSVDAGHTWASIDSVRATKISDIAVAPSKPATILVERAGHGVMGSYDSGRTWADLGYFVGCGNVCDILINPLDENVVLALEGWG